jgi:hypothetical protein
VSRLITPGFQRALSLLLATAFVVEGCAGLAYPPAASTQGQDDATQERDERECRERASAEVESPLAVGFTTKAIAAAGGAVTGVGLAAAVLSGGSESSEHTALVLGIGAAGGFVIDSIIGTFQGADRAAREVRARRRVFVRCMTERGYGIQNE